MQIEVRVLVHTVDRELRMWLVDELALISPTIEVHTADTLDTTGADLLIVGLDALTAADIDRLRTLSIPVIAIGVEPAQLAGAPQICVLDAKLTSRQLKRAVRDSLANRTAGTAVAPSAV